MNILFIGDIVGKPGRRAVSERLGALISRHQVDLVVANGENAAGGFGLTREVARDLWALGIDVLTSGNHIWDKKEALTLLDQYDSLLRPANYPPGLPGRGCGIYTTAAGLEVGVLNLEGRVFMSNLDCPFRTADRLVEELRERTPVILVDFHAEATSEKMALGHYLDGRISAFVGTHTHVQTADERILPEGTAYISDAGMTGSLDSVIGIRKELAMERFLTQLSVRFEVAKKQPALCGVLFTIDAVSGKALDVRRIQEEA